MINDATNSDPPLLFLLIISLKPIAYIVQISPKLEVISLYIMSHV